MMKLKVITGLILITLLTGCKPIDSEMSDYKGNTRYFEIISYEAHGRIVCDTRTGVEYWCSNYGVLTLLVNEDGKPLIYDRGG